MIRKCILRNYIPLLTKGVSSIEMNFPDIINILIGKNGHGKTRILAELNELPPENKNYEGEGYKYIEKEFNGKIYVLESYAGEKSLHSFKDPDGKELNPNGTQQVQKDLVRSVFGVTPLTNKILSGLRINDRFSALPDGTRKDFLMELYPNDTKYAMSVYDKLRQALNETVGAIRNQTKRLAEEKQREELIASMSVAELEANIAKLDSNISDALFIQGALADAKNVTPQLNEKQALLTRLTQQLVGMSFANYTQSKPEIMHSLEVVAGQIDYHKHNVSVYQSLLGELSNKINGVKFENINPELVQKQLDELSDKLKALDELREQQLQVLSGHPLVAGLSNEAYDTLNMIATFVRCLNNITPQSDETITLDRVRSAQERINAMKTHLRNTESRLHDLEHTIKHFNQSEEINCPECKSGFKPGFDKKRIEAVRIDIVNTQADIEQQRIKIKKGEDFLSTYGEWGNSMNSLDVFMNENGNDFFRSLVSEYQVGYKSTDNLINALRSLVTKISLDKKYNQTFEQKNVVEGRLSILKDNNMEEVISSYNQLDACLSASSKSLGRVTDNYRELNKTLDRYNEYEIKLNAIVTLKEEILHLLVEEGRFEAHRLVRDLIAEFSPQKDSYITTLIRKQSFHGVVESIEQNLAVLKDRQAKLKVLSEGLCPKKGLIGKMMLDFIKTLCGNVNAVIQEVWSTPLYLLPCLNAKGVLDYKFPVINGSSNRKAEDISYCSGGESEIINFAIMYVARKYHKANVPLFSDEFGSMMDEYHRRRFFDYVHRITSTGDVRQLFMVSHYHSEYGMLQGANLIALNTEGLTVPPNTNRNTVVG